LDTVYANLYCLGIEDFKSQSSVRADYTKKKKVKVIPSHSKQVLGVEGIAVPTISLSAGGVGWSVVSGNESWYPLYSRIRGSIMTGGK
jgi:hypothetical protein